MANIQTFYVSENGDEMLSANFKVKEFACKDGTDRVLIDLDLVDILQKIRDNLGTAVVINSGYRTPEHNATVNGAQDSYHVEGMAADIEVPGKSTALVAACAEAMGATGVLRYITRNFVHVDTRNEEFYAIYPTNDNVAKQITTHGDPTVVRIQERMNNLYGAGLKVDGLFGANTKRALVRGLQTEFNRQYNADLDVDGVWGPNTAAACRVVGYGSGNIEYIIEAGMYCIGRAKNLAVDGNYDTATYNAVRSFNISFGVANDGYTYPGTFKAMFG